MCILIDGIYIYNMCTGSAVELLGDEVPVLWPVERDELAELGVLGGAPVAARREAGLAAAAALLEVGGIAIAPGAAATAGRSGRVHGGGAGRAREQAAAALGRGRGRGLVGRGRRHAQQPRRGRRRARHRTRTSCVRGRAPAGDEMRMRMS